MEQYVTTLTIWLLQTLFFIPTAIRWLRVAQREHYEAGRVSRLALLWYKTSNSSIALLLIAAAALIASIWFPPAALLTSLLMVALPIGLSIRGSTAKLKLTGRALRLLAIVCGIVILISLLTTDYRVFAGLVVLAPVLTDLALLITRPVESLLARRFLKRAQTLLRRVDPITVAITGSYGKTTTKFYAEALLQPYKPTLASPASFNNLLGLSRAVNQSLRPGIEVFIAEMGTYGKGEIARLCRLFPPDISVITTIGEAHLERMGSRQAILEAKSEIVEPASTVVLNVDVPELADLANRLQSTKRVIRCSASTDPEADIRVHASTSTWTAEVKSVGTQAVAAPETGHPINFALAVGIVLAVRDGGQWISNADIQLPSVSHRAEVARLPNGVTIVDDTYNANPEGAASALLLAQNLRSSGATLWVVTPGMIELGTNQSLRNEEFGKAIAAVPRATLAIVGKTNLTPLLRGSLGHAITFPRHKAAVEFVASRAAAGDVILYENQLPDHYP